MFGLLGEVAYYCLFEFGRFRCFVFLVSIFLSFRFRFQLFCFVLVLSLDCFWCYSCFCFWVFFCYFCSCLFCLCWSVFVDFAFIVVFFGLLLFCSLCLLEWSSYYCFVFLWFVLFVVAFLLVCVCVFLFLLKNHCFPCNSSVLGLMFIQSLFLISVSGSCFLFVLFAFCFKMFLSCVFLLVVLFCFESQY